MSILSSERCPHSNEILWRAEMLRPISWISAMEKKIHLPNPTHVRILLTLLTVLLWHQKRDSLRRMVLTWLHVIATETILPSGLTGVQLIDLLTIYVNLGNSDVICIYYIKIGKCVYNKLILMWEKVLFFFSECRSHILVYSCGFFLLILFCINCFRFSKCHFSFFTKIFLI